MRALLKAALVAWCVIGFCGCHSVRSYKWHAFNLGEGFEVDCYMYADENGEYDQAKWKMKKEEVAKTIVMQSLREKGIAIEACEVVSFSSGRGGFVIGVVAGSTEFVKKAKDMGDGFWHYADLQHRKIAISGKGLLPEP
jgi:hypothetical protein